MSETMISDTRLKRVAAAEAELVGVTAERDALRQQNEQLIAENEGLDRNLDNALWQVKDEHLDGARWFTAGHAEPDDDDVDRWVLCSPHRGVMFTSNGRGNWHTPAMSHTYWEWDSLTQEYGPLLLVDDDNWARRIVDEVDARRQAIRTCQNALWDTARTLSSEVDSYRHTESGAPSVLAELADTVKELAKVQTFGQPPTDWVANTSKALAAVTVAVRRSTYETRARSMTHDAVTSDTA